MFHSLKTLHHSLDNNAGQRRPDGFANIDLQVPSMQTQADGHIEDRNLQLSDIATVNIYLCSVPDIPYSGDRLHETIILALARRI